MRAEAGIGVGRLTWGTKRRSLHTMPRLACGAQSHLLSGVEVAAVARDGLRLDRRAMLGAVATVLLGGYATAVVADEASDREAMVATIEDHARQAGSALGRTEIDARV